MEMVSDSRAMALDVQAQAYVLMSAMKALA